MTAQEVLERFEANMRAHPELATLATMLAPYRNFLGAPAGQVATLDALAVAYADARGLNLTWKEPTT